MNGEKIYKIKNQLQEIGEIATIDINDNIYNVSVNIMHGAFWIAKSRTTSQYVIKQTLPTLLRVFNNGFDFDSHKHIKRYYPFFKIHILIQTNESYPKQSVIEEIGVEVLEKLNLLISDVENYKVYASHSSFFSRTLRIDFDLINDTEVLNVPIRK